MVISLKGLLAYCGLSGAGKILLLSAGSVLVLLFFLFIFAKVTRKFTDRIQSLPGEKNSVLLVMDLKGYILFSFMIALGIVLKSIPCIPEEFFASFYCGLGPALLWASLKFLRNIRSLA